VQHCIEKIVSLKGKSKWKLLQFRYARVKGGVSMTNDFVGFLYGKQKWLHHPIEKMYPNTGRVYIDGSCPSFDM